MICVMIRNKKQGTTWEITDKAQIKRLLDDPKNYEEVKTEPAKPELPKKPEKSG